MVETAGQAFQNFLEFTHNFLASAGVGHALVIGKARSEVTSGAPSPPVRDTAMSLQGRTTPISILLGGTRRGFQLLLACSAPIRHF